MKGRKIDMVDNLSNNSEKFEKEKSKVAEKLPPSTVDVVITESTSSETNSEYDYADNDDDHNLSAACIASLCAG